MKLPFINSLPFIYKFKSYANALTGEHEIALYGRLFAIYRLSVRQVLLRMSHNT